MPSPAAPSRSPAARPCARRLAPLLLLLALLGPIAVVAEEPAPADPYREALKEAQILLAQGDASAAIRAFQQAGELTDTPAFNQLVGLADAYQQIGARSEAIEHCRLAIARASDDFQLSWAYNLLGMSLSGGEPSDAELEEAAAAFEKVLELSGGRASVARYNLAEVQLLLERDDEALKNLRRFLDEAPESPYAPRAKALLEEPRRARVPMMPEFEAETLEGDELDSAQLAGKVVLFDFWATWCAPCRQSVPTLRRLHRRAAKKGDPFVLVGVPGDDGFSPVRHYVEQEHIEWPQIWDESHVLAGRLFQVRGLPTYVLVDHEGMILFRTSGWNPKIATELRRRVAKAIDAARDAGGER